MSWPTFQMTVRLRVVSTASAAFGLIAVLLAVGALFPAVGHSFGKLNIPKGVADLLGGADYATITGWYRSEIASIYGPLVIAAIAITGVSSATAGEEEDRILALLLAHPITRTRLIAAKAIAIAILVVIRPARQLDRVAQVPNAFLLLRERRPAHTRGGYRRSRRAGPVHDRAGRVCDRQHPWSRPPRLGQQA